MLVVHFRRVPVRRAILRDEHGHVAIVTPDVVQHHPHPLRRLVDPRDLVPESRSSDSRDFKDLLMLRPIYLKLVSIRDMTSGVARR